MHICTKLKAYRIYRMFYLINMYPRKLNNVPNTNAAKDAFALKHIFTIDINNDK